MAQILAVRFVRRSRWTTGGINRSGRIRQHKARAKAVRRGSHPGRIRTSAARLFRRWSAFAGSIQSPCRSASRWNQRDLYTRTRASTPGCGRGPAMHPTGGSHALPEAHFERHPDIVERSTHSRRRGHWLNYNEREGTIVFAHLDPSTRRGWASSRFVLGVAGKGGWRSCFHVGGNAEERDAARRARVHGTCATRSRTTASSMRATSDAST